MASTWNITVPDGLGYPYPLTVDQRNDLIAAILGLSGVTATGYANVETLMEKHLQDGPIEGVQAWSAGSVMFASAVFHQLGVETGGNPPPPMMWDPILDMLRQIPVTGSMAQNDPQHPSDVLFESLLSVARSARDGSPNLIRVTGAVEDYVPAALYLAGQTMLWIAARHPHAPRINPNATDIPRMIRTLTESLARSIDEAMAASDSGRNVMRLDEIGSPQDVQDARTTADFLAGTTPAYLINAIRVPVSETETAIVPLIIVETGRNPEFSQFADLVMRESGGITDGKAHWQAYTSGPPSLTARINLSYTSPITADFHLLIQMPNVMNPVSLVLMNADRVALLPFTDWATHQHAFADDPEKLEMYIERALIVDIRPLAKLFEE